MRPIFRLCLPLTLLLLFHFGMASTLAEAPPTRVAVVVAPSLLARPTAIGVRLWALRGYLIETFSRQPRLAVASPERIDQLCAPFASGVYDVDAQFIRRQLESAIRLDACIYLSDTGGGEMAILRGGSDQRLALPLGGENIESTLPAVFSDAATFACRQWQLPFAAPPMPKLVAAPNGGDVFRTYFGFAAQPPLLHVGQERRLNSIPALESYWPTPGYAAAMAGVLFAANPDSETIACVILAGLASTASDSSKELAEKQRTPVPAAVRAVLGTRSESAAYAVVPLMPADQLEPMLQALARPLIPGEEDGAEVDELYDSTKRDKDVSRTPLRAKVKSPGKDEGSVSRDVRLGALRTLGFVPTGSALGTLARSAGSADPVVREAAAFALASHKSPASEKTLIELSKDKVKIVALTAMGALHRRKIACPGLLEVLRAADDSTLMRPLLIRALTDLATGADRARLSSLFAASSGESRAAFFRARVRIGDVSDDELAQALRDADPSVIFAAVEALTASGQAVRSLTELCRLANDPDHSIAQAASDTLAAITFDTPRAQREVRLASGSQGERWGLLSANNTAGEIAGSVELLRHALTNPLPLIRFESLRQAEKLPPDQARALVIDGLADVHRWVRLQAASMAVARPDPAFEAPLRAALGKEKSEYIRPCLESAIAAVTGAPQSPDRPKANIHNDAERWAWTLGFDDKDRSDSPFKGVLCYITAAAGYEKAGKPGAVTIYGRALWGGVPEGDVMLRNPAAFDAIWNNLDGLAMDAVTRVDGFDLRILGLGIDWGESWRDFCRESNIDPSRVKGDIGALAPSERVAFDDWALRRAIRGYNLLYDLVKLRYRYVRPNLRVTLWGKGLGVFAREVVTPLDDWRFDLGWGMVGNDHSWSRELQARFNRTIWPGRAYVYDIPAPGGLPDYWIQHKSPMPSDFIYQSQSDVYAHTLQAWATGSHARIVGNWRFVDYKTVPQGLYTEGVNVAFTDLGAHGELLEKGIEHAFKDAPIETPKMPGDASAAAELEDSGGHDAATRKRAIRVGMRLMQKHLYDCARIFASLPRMEPQPDTLLIQPGLASEDDAAPATSPPVNASRELFSEVDALPGINLLPGRDLARYRVIVVNNAKLLRDDTIRALSQWLRATPGLLVIHQDLTSDKAAEAGTASDHDGRLTESWPWERDFAIRPAEPVSTIRPGKLALQTDAGELPLAADLNHSDAECLSPKAAALARVNGRAVLLRWRDPAFRGAVLFDGLRAPAKPYVDLLVAEINRLAAEGIGRAVTGRPVVREYETDLFHAAISPPYGDPLKTPQKIVGIDLLSGCVDPVVGPKSASVIVPKADYFRRYLACTTNLVALGEREFTQAGRTPQGLLLKNDGVIQIAGRKPPGVTRAEGGELPAVKFDYLWLFDSEDEGTMTYRDKAGKTLTFVRSRTPVLIRENP